MNMVPAVVQTSGEEGGGEGVAAAGGAEGEEGCSSLGLLMRWWCVGDGEGVLSL